MKKNMRRSLQIAPGSDCAMLRPPKLQTYQDVQIFPCYLLVVFVGCYFKEEEEWWKKLFIKVRGLPPGKVSLFVFVFSVENDFMGG